MFREFCPSLRISQALCILRSKEIRHILRLQNVMLYHQAMFFKPKFPEKSEKLTHLPASTTNTREMWHFRVNGQPHERLCYLAYAETSLARRRNESDSSGIGTHNPKIVNYTTRAAQLHLHSENSVNFCAEFRISVPELLSART